MFLTKDRFCLPALCLCSLLVAHCSLLVARCSLLVGLVHACCLICLLSSPALLSLLLSPLPPPSCHRLSLLVIAIVAAFRLDIAAISTAFCVDIAAISTACRCSRRCSVAAFRLDIAAMLLSLLLLLSCHRLSLLVLVVALLPPFVLISLLSPRPVVALVTSFACRREK